ncbi:MAG: GNAT family N-acetyltransferase [Planctomycetes bacterium]|nr:GNAT family N-acetyltransferase [Planctomycetota bacterium]
MSPQAAAIEYRIATGTDALSIGVLGTQVFLDTYAPDGVRPALAQEVVEHFSTVVIAERLALPTTAFIVAESAGHLIGFAELDRDAPQKLAPPGITVELLRLYVQKQFHGKGVGKALLGRSETWARTHGAKSLWLTTWVSNDRAIAFYKREGYQDVGMSIYTYDGEDYENRVFVRSL